MHHTSPVVVAVKAERLGVTAVQSASNTAETHNDVCQRVRRDIGEMPADPRRADSADFR